MDLRLYPLDKQVCVLQIASCKYIISLFLLALEHEEKCLYFSHIFPPQKTLLIRAA